MGTRQAGGRGWYDYHDIRARRGAQGGESLERVECNAACDYAPVMVVNWEFMDNQTPQSALELVESLQAGAEVHSTRGPRICTWKQAARVLAGFPDGLAQDFVPAGSATLARPSLSHE